VDLTTLTPTFLADQPVDEFVSAIWTERYSKSGDTQIVVQATSENVDKLHEGTYLALRGSKEVMEIDTQNIENGLLTVVGTTLDEAVLGERFVWAQNPDYTGATDQDPATRIADLTDDTRKPGEFMSHLVDLFVINPVTFDTAHGPATLDWIQEKIPEISLGDIDHSGTVQRLTAPTGPLYDALQQLGEKNKVGFSLYLDSADETLGWFLKFKTYVGVDHTSGQSVNPLIRLTPELDGISDIKEVRSIKDFKNIVYVYYQGVVTKHLLDPAAPEPEGLDRRILVTDAQGEPVGRKLPVTDPRSWGGSSYGQTVVGPTEITAFREQNAKDALANHNYIRSIDGQTSPISDYTFGKDYFLGDLIELEGLTGAVSKAQVTEFIRSEDQNGEKSYPTISVVS
jgi:hypothetical protein